MALPVLLFLTLIALDFGRVYLGYINLQNMARIAANYAANNPDAWGSAADAAVQTRYESQILGDAVGEQLRPAASRAASRSSPIRRSSTATATASTTGLGDSVRVQLSCEFAVITPVHLQRLRRDREGLRRVELPGQGRPERTWSPAPPPAAAVPSRRWRHSAANLVISPSTISGTTPFVVEFRDTSGGSPDGVDLGLRRRDGLHAQDPLDHTFTTTDPSHTFHVTLTASNQFGSSTATMDVVVDRRVDRRLHGEPDGHRQRARRSRSPTRRRPAARPTPGLRRRRHGDRARPPRTPTNTAGSPYTVEAHGDLPEPDRRRHDDQARLHHRQLGQVHGAVASTASSSTAPRRSGTAHGFTGTVTRALGAPNGNFTIHAQSQTASLQDRLRQRRRGEGQVSAVWRLGRRRGARASGPGPGRVRAGHPDLPAADGRPVRPGTRGVRLQHADQRRPRGRADGDREPGQADDHRAGEEPDGDRRAQRPERQRRLLPDGDRRDARLHRTRATSSRSAASRS